MRNKQLMTIVEGQGLRNKGSVTIVEERLRYLGIVTTLYLSDKGLVTKVEGQRLRGKGRKTRVEDSKISENG